MTSFPLTNRLDQTATGSWLRDWRFSLACVILLACVVRLYNLGYSSLSHDEAGRANFALSATLLEARWFPPLHYVLLWVVRHTLGGSEIALRLPSALAGIACVVTLFLFTRRYLDNWAGVCVAAVAAGHAELVVFSRMVKEFSLESLMTVAVSWAGVEAYRNLTTRSVRTFAVCSVLALGLTYTGSLVVSAWGLVILIAWWSAPRDQRVIGHRFAAAVLFVIISEMLCYWWLSGAFNRGPTAYHYGIERGAWPANFQLVTLATWLFAQSYGALRYVLGVSSLYSPIDMLIAGYEILLVAVAFAYLRKRIPSVCAAAAVLWLVTVVVGAMGMWPYGEFHTMMFMVPLICLAVGCGISQTARKFGRSLPTALLVLVCIVNPAARACKNTMVSPRQREHLRPIMTYVERHAQPGDGIFAYYAAGAGVEHYGKRHDLPTLRQPTNDRGHLSVFSERFVEFARDHRRVWFVFTHDWGDERKTWVAHLKRRFQLADKIEVADASAHLFVVAPESSASGFSPQH